MIEVFKLSPEELLGFDSWVMPACPNDCNLERGLKHYSLGRSRQAGPIFPRIKFRFSTIRTKDKSL